MRDASKYFLGLHNFVNFCKIDVLQTTNYDREIREINIE